MSRFFNPWGLKCKIEVIDFSFEKCFDQHYDFFFKEDAPNFKVDI